MNFGAVVPPKRCPHCETVKAAYCFYPNKANRSGLSSWCKACRKVAARESFRRQYAKSPERERARMARRWAEDAAYRERSKARNNARRRRLRRTDEEFLARERATGLAYWHRVGKHRKAAQAREEAA